LNYNLTETQFGKVVRLFKEEKFDKRFVDYLRKIVEVLKQDGWEDDNIVDFILGLRYKDEFTFEVAKKYKHDSDFMEAVSQVFQC